MSNVSKPTNNIGKAVRLVRKSKGLSQEDFGATSSRTYVSTLERGMKSPTLGMIEVLAEVMDVHPLTLLVLSYLEKPDVDAAGKIFERIAAEIPEIK